MTSVNSTATCCMRKVLSGMLVLLQISRTHVNCGSHLTSCLVVVAHLRLTLTCPSCTSFLMTASPLSMLLALASRLSRWLRLFTPIRSQMIQALPDKQCSFRHGCSKPMLTCLHHFFVSCSVTRWSTASFCQGWRQHTSRRLWWMWTWTRLRLSLID